jgi:uncharacterized hydrophobic protein (TIGR00271 family)
MPRTIELSTPTEKTAQVVAMLRESGEVVTLSVQRGISVLPPGDVVTVRATSDGARRLIQLLRSRGLHNDVSISTSEVDRLVQREHEDRLRRETSESTWSEIAFFIRHETNVMVNYVLFMLLAGGVAAVGLWQNAPHIVVGAMLIAPALLPLMRISFGAVGGDGTLALRGISSTLAGYGAVFAGALLATIVLQMVDPQPWSTFRSFAWVEFWSTLSAPAAVVAVTAAAAGAIAVNSRRLVPLAGVLIALDLVPATGMAGMSLVMGDMGFAVQNLGRAGFDAAVVLVVGGIVFAIKRRVSHRHDPEQQG